MGSCEDHSDMSVSGQLNPVYKGDLNPMMMRALNT